MPSPSHLMQAISDWQQQRDELSGQVLHPVHEYDEARVERLVEQMELANRFQFDPDFHFNV